MSLALPGWLRRRGVAGLLMLYAGKVSGVLISLLFIPLFSRTLGDAQFGAVAVILSLQVLLMMLDLGLSTLIGRDLAAGRQPPETMLAQLRDAAWLLAWCYVLLGLLAAGIRLLSSWFSLDLATLLGCVALFGLLTLQNLGYTALLARQRFTTASTLQFVGNLGRAAATAVVLTQVSATLQAFVAVQVVCAALHALATGLQCHRALRSDPAWRDTPQPADRAAARWALLRQGAPLALMMAAGAAVMQLDKPIISALMSTASTAPYYLAMTLCLVPTSILAGPVTQYFQPQLIQATGLGESAVAATVGKRFVIALAGVTLLPCLLLWVLRDPLIHLWLGPQPSNALISRYVEILLPGITIGALGYLPYSLLLSVRDYRFQALQGVMLTLVTLGLAAFSATLQSVEGVCVVYATYHATAMLLSWARALYLPATRAIARQTALLALGCVAGTGGLALVTTLLIPGGLH